MIAGAILIASAALSVFLKSTEYGLAESTEKKSTNERLAAPQTTPSGSRRSSLFREDSDKSPTEPLDPRLKSLFKERRLLGRPEVERLLAARGRTSSNLGFAIWNCLDDRELRAELIAELANTEQLDAIGMVTLSVFGRNKDERLSAAKLLIDSDHRNALGLVLKCNELNGVRDSEEIRSASESLLATSTLQTPINTWQEASVENWMALGMDLTEARAYTENDNGFQSNLMRSLVAVGKKLSNTRSVVGDSDDLALSNKAIAHLSDLLVSYSISKSTINGEWLPPEIGYARQHLFYHTPKDHILPTGLTVELQMKEDQKEANKFYDLAQKVTLHLATAEPAKVDAYYERVFNQGKTSADQWLVK